MMSAQQLQYYSFLEQQRRKAIQHQSLAAQRISIIRRYIAGGGDPRKNPELSADYYALIDEYGESIFTIETEDGMVMYLSPENDSDIL